MSEYGTSVVAPPSSSLGAVLDNVLDDDDAASRERLGEWEVVWNLTYEQGLEQMDFELAGWRDSYTGTAIPAEQVRECVQRTGERIRALSPRRLLEVGCGLGLIIRAVAPHCERYVAVDLSEVAIVALRKASLPPQVDLRVCGAHQLRTLRDVRVDTVVITSVVQYFPSIEYFVDVLGQCLDAIEGRGAVFIGDLRSLPLAPTLHASLELAKQSGLSEASLKSSVARRLSAERELLIDPALFSALREKFPRITGVEILHKRGRASNELNRFRYDVVLHVGNVAPRPAATSIARVQWSSPAASRTLRDLLADATAAAIRVVGVPNARLAELVPSATLAAGAASAIAERQREVPARHPEDFWALSNEHPYRVQVVWAGPDNNDAFDVLLTREGDDAAERAARIEQENSWQRPTRAWSTYANQPLSEPSDAF